MLFELTVISQKILYLFFQQKYLYHLITIALVWYTPSLARTQTQIAPDNSLPTNVNNIGGGVYEITGGGQSSNSTNVFHSLKDFSIQSGDTARFIHPQGTENVITRITGGSPSQINGTIQTLIQGTTNIGSANLFLINPSGIIFGENARLDIGGSFFATTADKLKFADGTEFVATNPTANPLLTISVPVGLQYGSNPNSSIRVNGNGHNLGFSVDSDYVDRTNRPLGLHNETQTGKTIALVGANVVLDGGNVTFPSGRVEVWSVKSGEVSLINQNQQLQLQPGQGIDYGNIELSNAASIDASGNSAGSVQLQGKNISLIDGSVVFTDTLGDGTSGSLKVFASESIKVQGIVDSQNSQYYSGLFADVAPDATGNGSSINIESPFLEVIDGGQIQSATFGIGSAGDLYVKAKDIRLTGDSLLGVSGILSPVTPGATGNGGNLNIETENLRVLAGAQVTTTTFGSGNGGELNIKASDIEVKGVAEYIDPFTGESVEDPSVLATAVDTIPGFPNSGTGRGGNVKIQTQNLRVLEGGQISSATLGSGDAGNLQVNANNIELIGVSKTTRSGLFASAIQDSGNGGNITLAANRLNIHDGATISVSNFQSQNKLPPGQGAAGSIDMNVPFVLMQQGIIAADTNAGDFGNITIQSQNMVMRQGSRISTNASNSSRGGNLTISTNNLVAVENSDITANAQKGFGGRIVINAQGIFGDRVSQQPTLKSDITASSEQGLEFNGTVQVDTPDVDLSRGSVELPTSLTDSSQRIATGCAATARSNSLVFSGRGGIPENPDNTLRSQTLWYDLRNAFDSQQAESEPQTIDKPTDSKQVLDEPIVEAETWVKNSKGELELVAMIPNANNASLPTPSCD